MKQWFNSAVQNMRCNECPTSFL